MPSGRDVMAVCFLNPVVIMLSALNILAGLQLHCNTIWALHSWP